MNWKKSQLLQCDVSSKKMLNVKMYHGLQIIMKFTGKRELLFPPSSKRVKFVHKMCMVGQREPFESITGHLDLVPTSSAININIWVAPTVKFLTRGKVIPPRWNSKTCFRRNCRFGFLLATSPVILKLFSNASKLWSVFNFSIHSGVWLAYVRNRGTWQNMENWLEGTRFTVSTRI